tara:strand:+ start:3469 stop:4575 length:1107 start_codon:yes stop_codon:yes gene_type:complete
VNNSSNRIPVQLVNNPYEVVIEEGCLQTSGEELIKLGVKPNTKVLVVTNPDIEKHYGDQLLKSIKKVGIIPSLLIIEEGEAKKNLNTVSKIHDAAYETKLERGSYMIALGGGVVGDITGFAAATWLRGIGVIQIPTTLLAMVDASVGGKTGVNHPGGKNLIGAFHQPKLVLIDTMTLKTLPEREFRAGMAEVIKYAVIGDENLFNLLETTETISNLDGIGINLLKEIIRRSVITKARIVVSDEKEGGLRAILNYGHTFGHVVETLCGYGTYLHGEAVAIGMIAVSELSLLRNKWEKDDSYRQKELIKKAGLPINWPKIDHKSVIRTLEGDKKVKEGKIRFIIPSSIGNVEICNDITKEEINNCLSILT